MRNEWILDVIADLKRFAEENGMPELADRLTETADVASSELTRAELVSVGRSLGDVGHIGSQYRADTPRGNA